MLTLLSLSAAPVAAARSPVTPCEPKVTMTRDGATVRARPLTDLPNATRIQTVFRQFGNGCADLAVVQRDVGTPRR